MDSSLWQIRRTLPGGAVLTQTPAAWGIESESIRLEFVAQAADSLNFTVKRAFDDDDVFPFGATVELLRVVGETATVVFLGRIVRAPRQGSSSSESIACEAAGPWWWLDNIVFEQSWRFPDGVNPDGSFALLEKPLTRLLLGRSLEGDKVAAGAILTEVFDFLEAKFDLPLSLGDLAADFDTEIPAEEVRDLTCGEVVRRVLRWFPGITPRVALSPGAAVIHFRARTTDRFSLNPAVQAFGPVSLAPRHDLRPSCVLVRYYRHKLFGGVEVAPEVFEDKWPTTGDAYALDALRLVVQLDGGTISTLSQSVKTAVISASDVNWWKTKLPYLNNTAVTALSVVAGSDSVAADTEAAPGATVYANELLDGALPDWTFAHECPAIAKAKITYTLATEGGGSETRTESVQCRIRSTDAGDRTYTTITEYRAPETVPTGLAQRYFTDLDMLRYDGSVTLEQREWDGVNRTGWALDLAGFTKRPEWATMGTPVVRQSVDLHSGRVTYTVGPAKHLVPDDWISLARPAFGRAHATGFAATIRATGRLNGGASAPPPSSAEKLPRAAATALVVSPAATPALADTFTWQISQTPISPAPSSGPVNKLRVLMGRVNEIVGLMDGDDPNSTSRLAYEFYDLPGFVTASTSALPGAWCYAYLALKSGVSRPTVMVGASVPDDSDTIEYRLLASVRAKVADGVGRYEFEIRQVVLGDFRHKFRAPLECTVLKTNALTWKTGLLSVAVADVNNASWFNDNNSYSGEKLFTLKSATPSVMPSFGTETYSLWVAVAYPNDNSRYAQADSGKVFLTPTKDMPMAYPWLVVVEKNTSADTSRPSTDPQVATGQPRSSAEPPVPSGAPAASPTPMSGAAADADSKTGFTPLPGDTVSDTTSDTAKTGVDRGVPWTATIRKFTRTVTRAGVVVHTKSSSGVWSFTYTLSNGPTAGAWYMPAVVAEGLAMARYQAGTGSQLFAMSCTPNPVDYVPSPTLGQQYHAGKRYQTWVQGPTVSGTVVVYAGGVLVLAAADAPSLNLYSENIDIRNIWSNFPSTAEYVFNPDGAHSNTSLYRYYGNCVASLTSQPSNAQGPKDTTPPDPSKGDSPGRTPPAPGSSPTNDPPQTTGAKDKNGALVKGAGPGLWVYEIARIYPDGRVDQKIYGDIRCVPAAQVQLRVNPKVAALP